MKADIIKVERVIFVSKLYQQWIKYKKENSDGVSVGIYDIIQNHFGDRYNIDQFLEDYRFITHKRRDILGFHDDNEKGLDSLKCDIESCYITNRTNRKKSNMTQNNQQRDKMFFVPRENKNDGDCDKDIVIQNIMDSLHTFLYHTMRINYRKYIDKQQQKVSDDDEAEQEKTDISCFDDGIKKLGKIIKEIQQNSNRYTVTNNRYTVNNNKFITKNTSKYEYQNNQLQRESSAASSQELAIYQSTVYGNDQLLHKHQKESQHVDKDAALCFTDYLFTALNENKSKLNDEMVEKFKTFLLENSYETDSICYDINNQPQSNIMIETKDLDKEQAVLLLSIVNKFVYIESSHAASYSSGYRYFYWDYYKGMNKQWNILLTNTDGQPQVEGNRGYMIKDWYIPRKYKDLREELLTNATFTFSIQQFNNIKQQSTIKLKNWLSDPDTRPLESQTNVGVAWAENCYGIPRGKQITVQHIMSLLFYTNFSDHSAAFSGTFRRKHGFETDDSLKARNREFWNWSRLLRETVECYGQCFFEVYKQLPTVWHGVSAELIFDSTYIKLCGPLSTTAGFSFEIYFYLCSLTALQKIRISINKRLHNSAHNFWG